MSWPSADLVLILLAAGLGVVLVAGAKLCLCRRSYRLQELEKLVK